MLHQKEKFKLENGYIREYENSDFVNLFNMVWKLQQKIEVSYLNPIKSNNGLFMFYNFKEQFEVLIKKNKHKMLVIDKDRDTIAGFSAFNLEPQINRMVLNFGCKNIDYVFTQKAKELFLDTMRQFPNQEFRIFLGKRNDFDRYIKFMLRSFKHEYIGEDHFGRKIIDLDLT